MSYDFAIWESDASTAEHDAAATFEELFTRYLEADLVAPTPRIQAYSETLAAQFPDDDTPGQRAVRAAIVRVQSCTSLSATAGPTRSK